MKDRNYIHDEGDALDRELNALVRDMEQEEAIRRAVIEMLVTFGSDAMLEHYVLIDSVIPASFPAEAGTTVFANSNVKGENYADTKSRSRMDR